MSAAWIPWLALAATMLLALTAAKVLRRRKQILSRPVYLRQR
jgi:heme exporter protein D